MAGFGAKAPPSPGPFPHQEGRGAKDRDYRRYGAIILAAGLSSRMMENKLLLPWTGWSNPIICHAVRELRRRRALKRIVVVTGRDADKVSNALASIQLSFAHNPDFATGEILSSVKTGLRSACRMRSGRGVYSAG